MAKEQIGTYDWTSYNQLIEHKLDIDELIYVLSPVDLPLLTGVGSNGMAVLPRLPVTDRYFSWQEEDVPLPKGTLNEALDNSETDVTVSDNEAVKFPVGSTILIEDEAMKVTAINTTTHVLTVTRGHAGTSAATHVTGLEILGIGTILAEGSVGEGAFRGREKFTNYTQIFSRKFSVTKTEQLIPKYGVPSELARQTVNIGQHLNTELDIAAVYGVRYNDDTSETRSTGGLHYYISTNVDTDDDWLTIDKVKVQQQAIYDRGGTAEILMSRPAAFDALDNESGTERIQTVTIDDPRRGRMTAQVVMTEYGPVSLVRNRWVRKTDAFLYSPKNVILRVMRPFTLGALAKTQDADNFLIVGEFGMEVKGQEHMAEWTGLDQSAAMPLDLV